ncbi:M20/M25/M40 family metallo-hydrolase [Adhaeretor mobilis]|uniref:Leupeptin-inactivating enzyme 1 n=1 Tax=Adhaeretor mobilis TaxID=1930276 RepID=A0A517MVF2_9BACT|nr:M20/M25/M40 family metallo-hydrolase [Adhaeretor mobilis]QDS98767.1 Leupeptin-inactivating enzyme 1 precursor [Adhaeretor mobilis]
MLSNLLLSRASHSRSERSRIAITSINTWWSLALGLAACIATSGTANERRAMLDSAMASVTVDEIRDHAGVLAGDAFEGREAGARGGRAAAGYLQEQLQQISVAPGGPGGGYSQPFNGNMQNLLAVIPGTDEQLSEEYVIVGAHYDHVGYGSRQTSYGPYGYIHNGADDNASGVSALLEACEALVAAGFQPRRSVLFALWDGEEKNLLGSRHWLSNPTVPIEQVRMLVNIDMVGRMTDGRLQVAGVRTGVGMRKLFSSPQLPEGMHLDFSWEYKSNSDHWPFFERKIPAVYLHTGLHDDYHRPSDDVEKLNLAGVRLTSQYLVQVLMQLADSDTTPTYRSEARYENVAAQAVLEQPLSPLPRNAVRPRLGLSWRADAAEPQSVFVTRVVPDSPAEHAGIVLNDRLLEFAGKPIDDRDALLVQISEALGSNAAALNFVVETQGRIRHVRVNLKAADDPSL